LVEFQARAAKEVAYSHPILLASMSLALVTGPPAWRSEGIDWLTMIFVVTAPVAALREELFYRAILQRGLERTFRPITAIFLSMLAFVASHIGAQPMNAYTISAIAAFGTLVGTIYHQTRNLALIVLFHILFNLLVALPQRAIGEAIWILLGNVAVFVGALTWWVRAQYSSSSKGP
jgi:membrane protease YdiL (CAAX protease family)